MANEHRQIQQQIAMNFMTPSHVEIPLARSELKEMNIPLVLSITPFPRQYKTSPPILPLPFSQIPVCKNCNCVLNYKSSIREEKYFCSVCRTPNKLSPDFSYRLKNFPEIKQSVYDIYFPDRKLREDEIIQKPIETPKLFLLVIERSEITINNGIFVKTIQKIKETFINRNDGVISVFVFDSQLHVPLTFYKNKQNFKILSICDIEDENTTLPEAKFLFFDVKTEKKILVEYLDFLISSTSTDLSQINSFNLLKMYDLVKVLDSFCRDFKIPISIIASRCPIGTIVQYQNLALEIIRNSTSFKFFCINPSNETARSNDFTALSTFSMIVNSKCQVYSLCQVNSLPGDIINEMLDSIYFDNLFFVIIPQHFSIIDIKGPGLRRSENSIMIPAISPGDSVYAYLDYSVRSIQAGTHNIQAYVRFLDSHRRRFIRIINLSLYGSAGDPLVMYQDISYNVFIASTIISFVDKARESSEMKIPIEEFTAVVKKFVENNNIYVLAQGSLVNPTINSAFAMARVFFQNPMNFPLIMGKSPLDVVRFFVPLGYSIDNVNSVEMKGPFLLNNLNFYFGALYVKMHNKRALIIINEHAEGYKTEMAQEWVGAISRPPLQNSIQLASQEENKVIEIIFPSISADHNLYKHVMACIKTNCINYQ